MYKQLLPFLLTLFMSMVGAKAYAQDSQNKRTINVETAGTLPNLISADDKYQIDELTLSGELNGTDFNFLRNMAGVTLDRMEAEYMATLDTKTAGRLRVLDLSDAKIVEGGRDYYRMMTSSAMNTYGHYQYTKPDSITTCMFADFRTLEELVLPRSVKFISGDAFCDIIAVGFPVNLKVLKVADGNLYYDSRDNCNAVIKKETNELIAGCQATIIHNDVTSIGDNAFRYRQSLTSIDIPNSVTSIGAYAFSSSGLISIDLPSSITSIGDYAFSWCKSLTSFEIPDGITSISAGVFCASTVLSSIKIPGSVTTIGSEAFYSCSGLTSIEIPSKVETIGSSAFNFCGSLTSIKIPSSITAIGSFAFKNCNNLNYVVSEITEPFNVTNDIFPNVILFVPTGTLARYKETAGWSTISEIIEGTPIETTNGHLKFLCSKESKTARVFPDKSYQDLTEVNIPATINVNEEDYDVVSIGRGTFSGCKNLTSMVISNGISAIGEEAFLGCSGLTSLDIPNSVMSIGGAAFKNCSGLISISIPCNITTISNDLFSGCSSLTSIEIPDGVSTIGSNAFSGCSSLLSINIPHDITTIDSYTFYNCSSLTSLEIPNSVTSIGAGAFNYCSSLTLLKIPDNVTSIGSSAFSGCSSLTSLNIPHGITAINGSTFRDCNSLTSIKIPCNVTTIDYWAFQNCKSLISVEIPSSVRTIGVSAFNGCSSLTSVTVDIQQPLVISASIFSNLANATLYVPKGSKNTYAEANAWKEFKEIKEFVKNNEVTCIIEDNNTVTATAANDPTEKDVVIPESVMIDGETHPVTVIGDEAFKDNTSLTLVCIPETIVEIGEDAFSGCSGLTAIYSYNENPIPLGSANATVRTRASGAEIAASTVFAEVDKKKCILYVPKNSGNKYRNADGWGEFQNIVEMESNTLGDANNDAKVDSKDIDATVDYIMEGKTENFIFKNADVKTDSKVNAADIVEIVKIKK